MALEKFLELNCAVVEGRAVALDEALQTADVCFPSMLCTYKLNYSWFQQPYVHAVTPFGQHDLSLDEYMEVFHPRTIAYVKLAGTVLLDFRKGEAAMQ